MNPGPASAKTAWRQRGYRDGLAGRRKSHLVAEEHRDGYLSGYKNGVEAREKLMSK